MNGAGGSGSGAGCRRRGESGGGRRWLTRVTRKCDSGLRFGSSLAQEIVHEKGNSIRGSRRGTGGRRRRPAARGGTERRQGRAGAGKQERGKGAACEYPYPTAVLQRRSFDGGER
jgi:hypothetical protein